MKVKGIIACFIFLLLSISGCKKIEEEVISKRTVEKVDYSECFDGIEGCAVFYHQTTNEYIMYQEEACDKQSSPCSTFKIISTLAGLETKVIASIDTIMGYNGTMYSVPGWNQEVNLKEAFQQSCIWYFRKVIDLIGEEDMQTWVDHLGYGNCDISEWEGSQSNTLPELNGFWLESSLKISPVEQVNILADIFEGKTKFTQENIDLVSQLMLTKQEGDMRVYGKTGSGKNSNTGKTDNCWFVGYLEKNGEKYYFAVRLNDESRDDLSGQKAKEIALKIIDEF